VIGDIDDMDSDSNYVRCACLQMHGIIHAESSSFITYGHSQLKTGHPVRSAIHKQLNGRLVLRWVTTWESLLLYVLHLSQPLFLTILSSFTKPSKAVVYFLWSSKFGDTCMRGLHLSDETSMTSLPRCREWSLTRRHGAQDERSDRQE
jgi:hypothetical protein